MVSVIEAVNGDSHVICTIHYQPKRHDGWSKNRSGCRTKYQIRQPLELMKQKTCGKTRFSHTKKKTRAKPQKQRVSKAVLCQLPSEIWLPFLTSFLKADFLSCLSGSCFFAELPFSKVAFFDNCFTSSLFIETKKFRQSIEGHGETIFSQK